MRLKTVKPLLDETHLRSAFTLVEVLLALVLASMLSVVVIQVMRTTLIESRRIANSRQLLSETWLLREQLASDISNARGYKITNDTMTLGGFLARDPTTGTKTQQMALVTYRLVPIGNRIALERSEFLFADQQRSPCAEVVWYGVAGMVAYPKLESLEAASNSFAELNQLGLQTFAGGMSFRLVDPQGKTLLEIL